MLHLAQGWLLPFVARPPRFRTAGGSVAGALDKPQDRHFRRGETRQTRLQSGRGAARANAPAERGRDAARAGTRLWRPRAPPPGLPGGGDRRSRLSCRHRPYSNECTASHLNCAVKHWKVWLVLGWGTAWEYLQMLMALFSGGRAPFSAQFIRSARPRPCAAGPSPAECGPHTAGLGNPEHRERRAKGKRACRGTGCRIFQGGGAACIRTRRRRR